MASLCRIDVGRQPYFLKAATRGEKDGRGFDLILTDAVNVWEGKLSGPRMTELAGKVDMDVDEFTQITHKALTQKDVGDLAFEYKIKVSSQGSLELTWKKVMTNENIKFQLGSATLVAVDDPAEYIQDLFIFTIGNAASLRDNIRLLEGENERLSTERGNALKRLEKCVGMHEETEKELFSKFQVVLNDKKAKIRSLKQEVSQANSAAKTSSRNHASEAYSSGEESEDAEGEDIAEDEALSTDDEVKTSTASKKRSGPSSHKRSDSLILDEDLTNETAPLGKRRRRREITNKQTPSKPSIPKVSSVRTERSGTPSTSSVSQGDRVARATPGPSSKADHDVDNLFDEL